MNVYQLTEDNADDLMEGLDDLDSDDFLNPSCLFMTLEGAKRHAQASNDAVRKDAEIDPAPLNWEDMPGYVYAFDDDTGHHCRIYLTRVAD